MKAQKHSKKESASSWIPPVDITVYDRTPSLSGVERAAFDSIKEHVAVGKTGWPAGTHKHLHRLLRPIYDVFDLVGAFNSNRRATAGILLREMDRRNMSFWGWTESDWYDILHLASIGKRRPSAVLHNGRQFLAAVCYLLCGITVLHKFKDFHQVKFAEKVFGPAAIEQAMQIVGKELTQWGYGEIRITRDICRALVVMMLANRSPRLEDIHIELFEKVYAESESKYLKENLTLLSRGLVSIGILDRPFVPPTSSSLRGVDFDGSTDGRTEWVEFVERWFNTSTMPRDSRARYCNQLLIIGRWIRDTHPEALHPAQWTREIAAECVAAIDRRTVGQWVEENNQKSITPEKLGKPISARTKCHHLAALRTFFGDLQEWGWIPRKFDLQRSLATPKAIRALIGPEPRTIADDIWAKLLWAGLNLSAEDLPDMMLNRGSTGPKGLLFYPIEMIRAIVITWLFAGLRSDELRRLRTGCIRWQREDVIIAGTDEILPKDAVCLLDVPVNKTGASFTKPVDRIVGEAILAWEQIRPNQPRLLDKKTGELADYLFSYRGYKLGEAYINKVIIPVLCGKANVPESDARGNITSHRARSTIASMLSNSKNPMALLDLQAWLGHKTPLATLHYVAVNPTKLAKAYADSGYFERNLRTVSVLIDQEAIRAGSVTAGEPWKFYDLGHGYCTYDFFDQCPHRMACAKCSFYLPKESTQAQLLEGKANLQRMLQEIPLTGEEQAAVEDGLTAMERLCAQLANIPTPAGLTPRQLAERAQHVIPLTPTNAVASEGKQ